MVTEELLINKYGFKKTTSIGILQRGILLLFPNSEKISIPPYTNWYYHFEVEPGAWMRIQNEQHIADIVYNFWGEDVLGQHTEYAETKTEQEVLELIQSVNSIDGDHHKAWIIDQVVRIITKGKYSQFVAEAKEGEDGPETYGWDIGIAP